MASTTTAPVPSNGNRIKLPGFGMPLTYLPYWKDEENPTKPEFWEEPRRGIHAVTPRYFPTALRDDQPVRPLLTLREYQMMELMDGLEDKNEWTRKVFDDTITAKWKKEGLEAEHNVMSEKCFDYCFEELRDRAEQFKKTGVVSAFDGGVYKSDIAVPADLKAAFKELVAKLEDVPDRHKDWHPGSDGKVLDIVHPSLFPLIYGRSRILPEGKVGLTDCIKRCGEGVKIELPKEDVEAASRTDSWSSNFQWLPCDVSFTGEGNYVEIKSYINNLHPIHHAALYPVIAKLFAACIPSLNATLTVSLYPSRQPPRIKCESIEYPEGWSEGDMPSEGEEEDVEAYDDRLEAWHEARWPIMPEPREFRKEEDIVAELREKTGDKSVPFDVDLRRDFGEEGLQVIVKLANIVLTPEKPEYEGGVWHVEGQHNEHIVATALYYYDCENITDSYLGFQQRVEDDLYGLLYEQNDRHGFHKMFNVPDAHDDPAVQELGDVLTREDRLLTFPNTMQHRVHPFQLADPTLPGHRKILAFFLVDPHIRVISTANVPCQQRHWWAEEVSKVLDGTVPREVTMEIMDKVDEFPIGLEDAKEVRERLMDERRVFVSSHNNDYHSAKFSMCEH